MNSITSSAVLMPPIPMTGILTLFAASHTMRSAMGLIAGPGQPGRHVGNSRPARFGVDGHGDESIHQRDRVRAGFLRNPRHLRECW